MAKRGTRFPAGVVDGIAHSEAGSANLIAGTTTIITDLDRVDGVGVSAEANTHSLNVSVGQGANVHKITITDATGATTIKVRYVAVGPRSKGYDETN